MAVNVTEVPAHAGFTDGATVTLTGRLVVTFMVTELEVAGDPLTHAAFEVMEQVTTSPLTGL